MRRSPVGLALALGLLLAGLAIFVARRERPSVALEPPTAETEAELALAPDLEDARGVVPGAETPLTSTSTREEPALVSAIVRVRSSTGVPLHGGRVSLEVGPEGGTLQRVSVRPDASGAYALEDLDPGPWIVRAKASLHVDGEARFEVVPDAPPIEVLLLLEARDLVRVVVLTPQGEPFPDLDDASDERRIDVVATREQPGRLLGEVLTEEEPRCDRFYPRSELGLDARTFGLLAPRCDLPLLVHLALGQDVLATEVLTHGMEEIVFTLDPTVSAGWGATLVFVAVDGTSREPLNVVATLTTGLGHHQVSMSGDARHEIATVPGPATLRVVRDGYEDARLELDLERGERRDLGLLSLARRRTGDVVVEIRAPVDGPFWLAWKRLDDPHEDPYIWVERDEVDARSSHALPIGRCVIQAGDHSGSLVSAHELVDVAEGTQELALELVQRARVELRSAQRRSVLVTDAFDLPVASERELGPEPTTLELAPGTYRAVVRAKDRAERTAEFVVTAQGATVDLP